LPLPKWLATTTHLEEHWFVDAVSVGDPEVESATPPALSVRGVMIDAAELVSV
jgi:hypothetical protein